MTKQVYAWLGGLLVLLLTSAQVGAQTSGATSVSPQTEASSQPPKFEVEEYQFVILKRGPKWVPLTDSNKAELEKLQAGHMANIQRMGKLGKLMAAGPLGSNNDGLAGIFIFKSTLDEAKALVAEDPAIQAGRLALDFYTWWGQKSIGAKFNEDYRKDPNTKITMTKYYLGLLKKSDQWTAQSSAATQQVQTDHLWHIRRMLDAKKYLAAGPFGGNHEIRGIVVIAAASLTEAKALGEADPSVKAGRHKTDYYEWYCAQEVWP